MAEGMDPSQFMHFRLALMPASGFQSVQFRYIEFMCTDIDNLLNVEKRSLLKNAPLDKKMEDLYWRFGSTDLTTGRKTLTLTRFEQKYDKDLVGFAEKYRLSNLRSKFIGEGKIAALPENTKNLLKELDNNINQGWRMVHLKSARKYLKKPDTAVEATGGTNWQKYPPPGFQQIIFFPELWSAEELENWGKGSHDFSSENAFSKT
jgi:tryptophan 2,3-dioxygenase